MGRRTPIFAWVILPRVGHINRKGNLIMVKSTVKVFVHKGYIFMLVPTERKYLLNYRLWFFNPWKRNGKRLCIAKT